MYRVYSLFIFVFIGYNGYAQFYTATPPAINNWVEQSEPQSIWYPGDDFTYIATHDGILRFDGATLTLIPCPKSAGAITAMAYDGKKHYIGTEKGSLYILENNYISLWEIAEGHPKSKITKIIATPGLLWIATYGEGVYIYDQQNLYNVNIDDQLSSNEIYDIHVDNQTCYAAHDSGLDLITFINEKKSVEHLSAIPNNDIYYDIEKLDASTLILATHSKGVIQYDMTKKMVSSLVFIPNECQKVKLNSDQLIILTEQSQMFQYDINSQHLTLITPSLKSKFKPFDFSLTFNNHLWAICKNNSLVHFSINKKPIDLDKQELQCVFKTNNDLYVGTSTQLLRKDKNKVISNSNILCMTMSKDKLLAGTYGDGLIMYDEKNNKSSTVTEAQGLTNNNIYAITSNSQHIYVSTLAGINQLDHNGKIIKTWDQSSGLPSDYNYAIHLDTAQNLWLGSDGKGIGYLDPSGIYHSLIKEGKITHIARDGKNRIWYTDHNRGLFYLEGKRIIPFNDQHGLRQNHITGIIASSIGDIIAIHHTGVDLVEHQTLSARYIHTSNQSQNDNENFQPLMCHLNDLYICTSDQILRIKNITPISEENLLKITLIDHGKGPILPSESTTYFPHHQNDFVLEYTTINYDPNLSLYHRYRLLPIDTQWRYTNDPKIIFANLEPNLYTLHLQSSANKSFIQAYTYTYSFGILTAWYKTWWFILCSLGLLAFAIHRYVGFERYKQSQLDIAKTLAIRSQLETLRAQINPHFLFNSFNTLISIIESDPEKAVLFAEKMSDYYRKIIQIRDKEWISVEEELPFCYDYIYLLNARFGDSISVSIDIKKEHLRLYIVPLSLQILLENAVKHNIATESIPLHIRIYSDDSYLIVENKKQLRNNPALSTQFGLRSITTRYQSQAQKEVIITDETYFIVKLPLIYSI
jgi:ligand-binding sensor domain-containing protein